MVKTMKISINLFVLVLLAAVTVPAANLSIILDNPDQTGKPGDTLRFSGVLANTDTIAGDASIYLNLDSLNLSLTDAVASDLFFANVPIDLAPGASSGDIELFDYILANPELSGVYQGSYTLLGGMDGGTDTAQDVLAEASFAISIESPSSTTPEPATWVLLVAGFVLTWLYRKYRHKVQRKQVCLHSA